MRATIAPLAATWLAELVQQRLRRAEIVGVEALGEPSVDVGSRSARSFCFRSPSRAALVVRIFDD
jgi:hypothetical protein